MADAPSLGDFFKSKGKKKIKATNLNKDTAAAKPDEPKAKKATEDDAWQEEQIVAQTMKVEIVGKLMRDEEKKDEEDVAAPAWGAAKKDAGSKRTDLTDKKYPTLAKSVASVNIDDGSDAKVNIATSKNVFAALEGEEDEDENGASKRPKAINSSMVSKKKGEFEKVALKREVDKYAKKEEKKAKKAEGASDEEEDEENEEAEEDEETKEPAEEEEKRREKKPKKKEAKKEVEEEAGEAAAEDVPEDLRMQPDLKAAKEKYTGRKRLPPVDLPRSEMQEQKENKPSNQQSGGKKKKFVAQEETEKKIEYAAW